MNDTDSLIYLLKKSQEHIKLGTWKINAALDNFFISDELCDIFLLDKSKSYDLEVLSDAIYKDDVNKILELFDGAVSVGIPFESSFRSVLNGELRYFTIFCDIEYKDGLINNLYGFIQDTTAYSTELEKRQKLLELTEEYIIISQTNLQGKITYVSKAFADISGYTKAELMGKNHNLLRHPDMPSKIFTELWETILKDETWEGEVLNLKKDGGHYWVKSHISPMKDYEGKTIGYQSLRHDITDKKYIELMSITDELTSLYNRRHFNTMLPKEINHSRRTNSKLIFAMLDVDNFKKYNDTYGHQMGDKVLIDLAKSLTQSFQRSHDMVFRLGGEEFGIVFTVKKDEDEFTLVDKARQNIENLGIEHKLNGAGVVTASFGVIEVKSDYTKKLDEEMEYVYKEADKALYKAKETGRNKVYIKK